VLAVIACAISIDAAVSALAPDLIIAGALGLIVLVGCTALTLHVISTSTKLQ
jgi:hypothetical protein